MILLGDCLERLKELEENSIDAVVTDPPYGLKFMGKKWDYDIPSDELWGNVLRVLKPGGHLLSFGGTRTYHRMVVNIENSGFEIRDQLQWLYGSGFPKSHDISKAIDKKFGAKREVVETIKTHDIRNDKMHAENGLGSMIYERTTPATPEAYRYKGWGTALKPANEPIVLARKLLEKGLTVAENMLKWGVGGLNIDESRIGTAADMNPSDFDDSKRSSPKFSGKFNNGEVGEYRNRVGEVPNGRWPANLLLDQTAALMLDEQSGTLKSGALTPYDADNSSIRAMNTLGKKKTWTGESSSGGASRFFYVAKASKRERNAGLGEQSNGHPTVKPIKLMEYLCKLITPPGGTILDPFCGSGSTGVAAFKNGFKFIGIEMNEEYCEIANKRIANAKEGE